MAGASRDNSDRAVVEAHWERIIDDPALTLRAITRQDGLVGHVARFERDGLPEVCYWISRAHWGRGFASEGLRLFLTEVTQRPLHARAVKDNAASIRVLERSGFVKYDEGTYFSRARNAEVEEFLFRIG